MKTKSVRWSWVHNGFHGHKAITILVPAGSKAGDIIHVSPRTAARIDNIVGCYNHECKCGEHVTVPGSDIGRKQYDDAMCMIEARYVELPVRDETVKGIYPQA